MLSSKGSIASSQARASRRSTVSVSAANVLIANTKGGGHAFIGLYLAKQLIAKGHTVTILNDGNEAKLSQKAPFSKYSSVDGLKVVYGNPADPSSYPASEAGAYDVVYDNNGKDMASCQPMIDHFKGKVAHYIFVGSAGAYKADGVEPQAVEGDARKSSAGHVEVEAYLKAQSLPFTVLQPLYIYGQDTAKDCEQWWIDRVIRDRPVPIPGSGVQLTTLSHVEDVAAMLAAVPGNAKAIGQQYNVCSDRCITFSGIAKAVGKALGKEPKILLYDPEATGTGKPGKADGFPSGEDLRHDFLSDIGALVADYNAQGRASQFIDFTIDDKIIAATSTA
ncbi:MAG: hypothetical protein WDW36_005434 [Sanguina aurantia]